MADNTEQPDTRTSPRSPVVRWLHNNSTWLGAAGAIAAVVALLPVFVGSSETGVSNTVHVGGDNNGGQIAGGDITTINVSDPLDRLVIESLLTDKERLLVENDQLRDQVTDAVTGLSSLDSEPSTIDQARMALANGDTEQAQALYRADAENKVVAGEAQLRGAAESYRRLGALAYLNDTAAAIEAYQHAVEAWPGDIGAWNQLGHLYQRAGQLDQAIKAYRNVEELATSTEKTKLWTAISQGNLGNVHRMRGELDQAVEMYKKSLAIGIDLGNKFVMANDYGNLGIVHQSRGELDQAVEMYEKSLVIYTSLGSQEYIASVYGNLGIVHQSRGELSQAVEMYKKSLTIYTELGIKEGIANQLGNLGVVHQMRDELDQAVQMYEQSLAISTKLGSKKGIAIQYGNLGDVHRIRGNLDEAFRMHEKSLAISLELGSKEDMANQYGNIGLVHKEQGELDQAIEMYKKSLAISIKLNYVEGSARQYRNLGLVHRIRGELDQSRASWQQAVLLYKVIDSPTALKVQAWIDELDGE